MDKKWFIKLFEQIIGLGIDDFCVCSGKRNAPILSLLEAIKEVKKFPFYDERSAAFFALGRARKTNRPVAVCTTSGTATGELLPAVMEAYYTGTPLVLLTADRPKRFRGTGAPQSAEQKDLYGLYTPVSYDIEEANPIPHFLWPKTSPIHINICIEEPDSQISYSFQSKEKTESFKKSISIDELKLMQIQEFLSKISNPLVIVSTLLEKERESVKKFLISLNAPAYLEGVSGLREDTMLQEISIRDLDLFLKQKDSCDSIFRIGGIPSDRFWRDLEETKRDIPVLSLSSVSFSGLTRGSLIHGSISAYLDSLVPSKISRVNSKIKYMQDLWWKEVESILQEESCSEQAMINQLSKRIGKNCRIYLGNSLPIREWNTYACRRFSSSDVWASRGLNGIDGQMSTFFGLCDDNKDNWAILGDLTTLYDCSAPWIMPYLEAKCCNLVVVNNKGGMIFSRMNMGEELYNRHEIEFEHFAKLWGMDYHRYEKIPKILPKGKKQLIEILPDEQATKKTDEKIKKIELLHATV